jgi:hypothetical protein
MVLFIEDRESAYQRRISSYIIKSDNNDAIDLINFLEDANPLFSVKQSETLEQYPFMKTFSTFIALLTKTITTIDNVDQQTITTIDNVDQQTITTIDNVDQQTIPTTDNGGEQTITSNDNVGQREIEEKFYISCGAQIIDRETDLSEWYTKYIAQPIQAKFDEFEINGSGWTLARIEGLVVYNNKYEMLRGSSYIKLPLYIANKKAVINVKNLNDEECFKWALLSALHPARSNQNATRVQLYYPYRNELNFSGITFPVTITSIKQFEEQNTSISINIYAHDKIEGRDKVLPIRLTKTIKDNHIHLLLLQQFDDDDDDEDDDDAADAAVAHDSQDGFVHRTPSGSITIKSHYCWIKNMSRLIGSQVSEAKKKIHLCDRCLHYFYTEEKLNKHLDNCIIQNKCAIVLPSSDNKYISFKSFNNALRVPFSIYADLESILKPVAISHGENTAAYQKHEAFSMGFYFKSDVDDSQSFYKSRRGLDCVNWFCTELYKIFLLVQPMFRGKVPMQLTNEEEELFQRTERCHICSSPFSDLDVKCRDHNHLTGKFRGAAHTNCNLRFQESRVVPVIFHNLTGKFEIF